MQEYGQAKRLELFVHYYYHAAMKRLLAAERANEHR